MGKLKDRAASDWVRGLQEDAGFRRMRRVQNASAKAGTDYDYKNAIDAGLFTPKGHHWPSRVPSGPKEGLLLKSPKHPTFGKTIHSEFRLGNRIVKREGRLYSEPRR